MINANWPDWTSRADTGLTIRYFYLAIQLLEGNSIGVGLRGSGWRSHRAPEKCSIPEWHGDEYSGDPRWPRRSLIFLRLQLLVLDVFFHLLLCLFLVILVFFLTQPEGTGFVFVIRNFTAY